MTVHLRRVDDEPSFDEFVYGAKDPVHNQAAVLRDLLD